MVQSVFILNFRAWHCEFGILEDIFFNALEEIFRKNGAVQIIQE